MENFEFSFKENLNNVLIVEDDPFFQMILIQLIKRINPASRVRVVATLMHARMEVLHRKNEQITDYDLILADHHLPDGTGLDFWKTCQKHTKNSTFILTSGMKKHEFIERYSATQVTPPYLTKVMTFNQIKATIVDILKHQSLAA